jgi:hypothetical protein
MKVRLRGAVVLTIPCANFGVQRSQIPIKPGDRFIPSETENLVRDLFKDTPLKQFRLTWGEPENPGHFVFTEHDIEVCCKLLFDPRTEELVDLDDFLNLHPHTFNIWTHINVNPRANEFLYSGIWRDDAKNSSAVIRNLPCKDEPHRMLIEINACSIQDAQQTLFNVLRGQVRPQMPWVLRHS